MKHSFMLSTGEESRGPPAFHSNSSRERKAQHGRVNALLRGCSSPSPQRTFPSATADNCELSPDSDCVRERGVISASCMRVDFPRLAHIAAGQVTLVHCCTGRIKGSVRGLRRRGRFLRTPSWRVLLDRSEKRRN
ncbi:hypothetical protein SRHO_G00090640 [Serrasalmus rhombeus]